MTIITKRKIWSIGCVGSCSFFPVDCEANYWLRQGQKVSTKRSLPITEIKLAIKKIDRVLSSLGCLTEKQPKLLQFLQYQSMLSNKTTSNSQKMTILIKRKNWSIGCVGSCSFFPVDCEANYWLRQGQKMSTKRSLPITGIKLAIMKIDHVLSSLGCLREKQPKIMHFLQHQSMLNNKTSSDSQKMTVITKRKNGSIGCVGSCSFFPVDCEATYWLRQGQKVSTKRSLPITEINLAIMKIDRVLSSLGCLTEKQPKLLQFLEIQSMLNSTKNHKWFSKNENINKLENVINWLRRFLFFLSGWLWS